VVRGELDLALRLDEDLLRLSRQRNDSAGLVQGHLSFGRTLMYAGQFASSRAHLEDVLALYDPISHHSLVHQVGLCPQVASRGYLQIVLFCLGYPGQALAQSKTAIAEARRLAHPPSLAPSLAFGARLLALVGDNADLGEQVDQLVAVATEQGFPHWRSQGTIYRGWVKVKNGDVAEGISLLRSGSSAYRATGAELWMPQNIELLARACEIAGELEEATTLLDDSLQIVERTGERWFAAELNRRKGQLLRSQGDTEAAEELYRKALRIAAKQEAKLWESWVGAKHWDALLWRRGLLDNYGGVRARRQIDDVPGLARHGHELSRARVASDPALALRHRVFSISLRCDSLRRSVG
jgi:predicted ATPase